MLYYLNLSVLSSRTALQQIDRFHINLYIYLSVRHQLIFLSFQRKPLPEINLSHDHSPM